MEKIENDRLLDISSSADMRACRWYVAATRPRNEEFAATNLIRQGFPIALPRRLITRRRSRRFVRSIEPLFPGYIFTRFDIRVDSWRKINSTYGVSRLVAFGELPASLPPGLVESLISSMDENGALVFTGSLCPGDQVKLISGPFADRLGVLEHLNAQGRVRLLLELLGGQVRITTSRAFVQPLAAEPSIANNWVQRA